MKKLSEIDAPNEAGAVDGGIPLLLYIARASPPPLTRIVER
jgi:hypothetical protein